jgi:hypothetical protein
VCTVLSFWMASVSAGGREEDEAGLVESGCRAEAQVEAVPGESSPFSALPQPPNLGSLESLFCFFF